MAIAFNNQNNSIGLGSISSGGFTTSITINSTGVGIGTTNPTSKLHVVGDGFFTGVITATKFSGQLDAASGLAQSVGFATTSTTSTNVIGGIASVTELSVSKFSTVGVLTATSIGIGTTNPTSKLHVVGDGYFSGVVTSAGFYVGGELIGQGGITGTNLVGTSLSISGISTSAEFVGGGSGLRNLSGTHLVSYASHSETSNSALSIAGISTYTQVGILTGSLAVDSNDNFGASVASSADGKTIIVGATGDEIGATTETGIAYVFDRIGNSFNQVGILTGSFAGNFADAFGFSVATSADGKTIIVGVPNDEIGAITSTGIVYVFDRIGNYFNQVGILTGSLAGDDFDRFGQAVTISADGKTIISSAVNDNIGASFATGIVYVFDRIGNSFNQVGILTGSFAVNNFDSFGNSVSTSADGKTIIVGASADENTGSDRGLVYVFDRIGSSFNQVGILTGSLAVNNFDGFGASVASSADGKTIIVGAHNDEIGATTSTGVVYVFDRVGNSFDQVGILTGSFAINSNDNFGRVVSTSADGKTIIVGAPSDEIGAITSTGVVYVFKRQGNLFNRVGILTGSFAVDSNDGFGNSVSTSADGKTIIVGASADENTGSDRGLVYVFDEVRETYVYSGPTGNIGIGTTNPTAKLWVNGDGYFTGVVTATKFFGDGSQLTGLTAGVSISTNTTNQSQLIPYVTGTGTTTGFGVTTTGLVFNPSSGNLGIGTDTLTTTLNIGGALGFTNNNIRIGDANTGCSITSGTHNFFAGSEAGRYNTTGNSNNFIGRNAGRCNTTGNNNNFFGNYAGRCNTTGGYNNFFGPSAGRYNTTGNSNNIIGNQAGFCNTTGRYNNFFGRNAGRYNTTGSYNNFLGANSGLDNTTGCYNNFFGNQAGLRNTTGSGNNFLGYWAGRCNTDGCSNNFFGPSAGRCNTTGGYNNFFGYRAGFYNTTGNNNNFLGAYAGKCNTTGCYNNFFGYQAGRCNTTGCYNNFFGSNAGYANTTGGYNNFFGESAGRYNTSGSYNNFLGNCAGYANITGCQNNFLGQSAGQFNTTGCNNNFLGQSAGFCNTTGCSNNFFGPSAGRCNTSGGCNNFFGCGAGKFNTTGNNNNFLGNCAGFCNTTGSYNNFFGQSAGRYNTTGNNNNFFGIYAGFYNATGCNNNFLGNYAGRCNTTGCNNNFIGNQAGRYNTTGCYNNFLGREAGYANTTGSYNNFLGQSAGFCNTTGCSNNFFGPSAGRFNTSGCYNNFFGPYAGFCNTTGCNNNFIGNQAGKYNTTGCYNNFFGRSAGFCNTSGSCNNFFGLYAGRANTTGCQNNFLGAYAGCTQTLGDRNVAIGYNVQLPNTTGSNQLNIGSGSDSWITGKSDFNVGIGTTNPTQKLHILGNARVTGAIYDSTNAPGTTGQVLQSTITGTLWATAAAGGGDGTFDTGITTTTFVSVDSGIGTAVAGLTTVQANNDIFFGPGIGLSFPNIAGNRYVIKSIHVTNTFDNELYLTARHDFNNGTLKVPVANRVVIPYNGALELLEQPTVANPGDILRLQALSGIGTTAGGVDGGLDAWITYTTKTDTNFVGVGTTVTTAGTNVGGISTYQTVYTSTTYPSVIQSIRIANYNLFIDVDASIAIFSSLGIRKGHLAYNLTIPKNSIVELCQQPKRLQASETLGVSVGSTTSGGANSLSVFVSSKYIT